MALATSTCESDQSQVSMDEEIRKLAGGRFEKEFVEEFISKFDSLVGSSEVVNFLLQISTDEGDELELGFFTAESIADITLSKGKVYSCLYPLCKIRHLDFSDAGDKWVLTITGEKKFDYNAVKPASPDALKEYEIKLREYLRPRDS